MRFAILLCLSLISLLPLQAAEEFNVWPAKPPGEMKSLPPEADTTKAEDKLIAGRRIIKLGNVSTPTITVYQPLAGKRTDAAVVICPGGGHHILAMDLEGTEVAEWFNSIGVTAFVLKYRVPARNPEKRYEAAVQDAQRAMSLIRSSAKKWAINPQKIGLLGFSAGGETAALTALLPERLYPSTDEQDKTSFHPNFLMLIYPGGLANKENTALRDYIKVTPMAPPTFFVHTFDDGVHVAHSMLLYLALKDQKVPAELHAFSIGGHGYGLRKTEEPVTEWPALCEKWLRVGGWIK